MAPPSPSPQSIYHRVNNQLTVILGHAQCALGRVHDDDVVHGDLVAIVEAVRRATLLVRELRHE